MSLHSIGALRSGGAEKKELICSLTKNGNGADDSGVRISNPQCSAFKGEKEDAVISSTAMQGEKRVKRFEKKSETQQDQCCPQAMADLATESWRLDQSVQRAAVHMDPMEANRFLNQYEWYRRVLRTALAEAGLRVVDVTGEPYQVGMAGTPLNLEDFPDDPFAATLWESLGERARRLDTLSETDPVNKFSADITAQTDFDAVCESLGGFLDTINHNGVVVEFVPKGHSKATGMEIVRKYYDVPAENIYAVGDGMNDMAMIKAAAHSIAMGQGNPELLMAAEYVTDSVYEDGIYRAFKHYKLI